MIPRKKRILINIHYLEIGGAETSLIGLLHSLKPGDCNIDLLINDPRGELMKYIPEWVNIISAPKPYNFLERPLTDTIKAGQLKLAFARLLAKYKFLQYYRRKKPKDGNAIFGYVGKYTSKVLPSLKVLGKYDVAISYVSPHNIVADKVNANKKIAWIHTDYSQIDVNANLELPVWQTFDKIVSISPTATKSFIEVFPLLENKLFEIKNILPRKLIFQNLIINNIEIKTNPGQSVFLTIARFSPCKRLDKIPVVAYYLKKREINFKWFIIGYGSNDELKKIQECIKEYNVNNHVIILGKKANPYPYIKKSDIYIQTSEYEGYGLSIAEAKLLRTPVISTSFKGIEYQIKNNINGIITSHKPEDIARSIEFLIKNPVLYNKIKKYLKKENNPIEVDNFLKLIN